LLVILTRTETDKRKGRGFITPAAGFKQRKTAPGGTVNYGQPVRKNQSAGKPPGRDSIMNGENNLS
jgi:hypothetical protein